MNGRTVIYRSKVLSQLDEIYNSSDIITAGFMEFNISFSVSIVGNVRPPSGTLNNRGQI
jgi:hypothetical protein